MVEHALHYILSKTLESEIHPASKGQKNHQSMQRSQKVPQRSRSANYRENEDLEQQIPQRSNTTVQSIKKKEKIDPNHNYYISVLTVNIPQADISWCDW